MTVTIAAILFFYVLERFFQDLFRHLGVGYYGHDHDVDLENSEAKSGKEGERNLTVVGYLNLVSDFVHNIVDGLAIGAAYSQSLALGFSTTLAIAFHEIAQELGSFFFTLELEFDVNCNYHFSHDRR